MQHRMFVSLCLGMMVAGLAGLTCVADAGDICLVVNGDAETGEMAPWLPDDELEVISTANSGDEGLPEGYDIGSFCFTAALGADVESGTQIIDLSSHGAAIDAGCFSCTLSGALQSRRFQNVFDRVTCSFVFENAGGTPLATHSFVDPSITETISDWSVFEETVVPPVNTRQVRVQLLMTRDGGASTDAFADNICISIPAESCPADVDLSGAVDVNDLLALLAAWGPYDGPCDVDILPDGVVDVNDLLALLAAWGPCV